MSEIMTFPETVEEFMEQYKVVDTEKVYTSGIELVPIFRMKQWFEHLPAVPHEMSAREFAEARDRLCDSMNMCTGCPIYKACLTNSLTKILPMVEAWVQEHPEEMQYCPDDDGSCSCADVDMRQEDEDAYGEHSYITMDEAVAYAEKWAREHSDERSEE